MTEVLGRLRAALADRFAVQRKIGSGGMAAVYLAEDLRHHRPVAIKVLHPALAQVLGADRFVHEIETAAGLTHPHILPLHDSGEAGGLLYYVMPFVEGESLRDRMAREKQLPLDDALQIAREVADALGHAHSRGVIHRDIKPENILLQSGHAVVADFGIARAIDAAGGDRLTATGMALGTPAYMSPEQAAGSRDLDGRSDLYALGCVLYEMLTGEPPFTGPTVESIVHQHLSAEAPQVSMIRTTVPAAVAATVRRALAKVPADRPRTGSEFAQALAVTPAGATPAAAAQPSGARVAGLYLGAAAVVLVAASLLTSVLGLPSWVLPGAAVLLALGIPVVAATERVVRARHAAPAFAVKHLTRRRAMVGGVTAVAGWGLVVAVYMAMRALGLGPVGSLFATGALAERDGIIVADFSATSGDSLLSRALSDALRIDLSQSRVIRVLDVTTLEGALQRMRRDSTASLDLGTVRELAAREGYKAVVGGEIGRVGAGFVIAVRLMSTPGGETLVALRETADDSTGLLQALDRVSDRLRDRIGESLRTIRASPPLEQVTTASLEALGKYTLGRRVYNQGDRHRGYALFREAVGLDSGFAMAWRGLSFGAGSAGDRATQVSAMTQAFQLRQRLPERERYTIEAAYYSTVTNEVEKAIGALQSAVELDSTGSGNLNNLGTAYADIGDAHRAEETWRLSIGLDSTDWIPHRALGRMFVRQGRFDEALAAMSRVATLAPTSSAPKRLLALLEYERGNHDAAETHARLYLEGQGTSAEGRAAGHSLLKLLTAVRGQLRAAEQHAAAAMALAAEVGGVRTTLVTAVDAAYYDILFRGDKAAALRKVDRVLERHPLSTLAAPNRPYVDLAIFFALAGEPVRARAFLTEYEGSVDSLVRRPRGSGDHRGRGAVALAEGRFDEAIGEFRRSQELAYCTRCGYYELARAYEGAGQIDSALAQYERYLVRPGYTPNTDRLNPDEWWLALTLRRLGQLYDQRDNRERALEYYSRFVELWKDADPDLQPQVQEVRQRIARLALR